MADQKISIGVPAMGKVIASAAAIAGIAVAVMLPSPYTLPSIFIVMLMIWGSYYAFIKKDEMTEMCCMMSGMAYGMISGFFIGALAGLATGDFMIAMVIGTVAGIIFGIPVGRLGGPLGRMEGVMAGPMGGIMGGMTGVMVQFFSVQLFMPFLVLVVIFTVWEMTNVIGSKISRNFMYLGLLLSVLALTTSAAGIYANPPGITGSVVGQADNLAQAPDGSVQEITIRMTPTSYSPDYIVVKKDIPVRIKLQADITAGCTRSIVFPDFNIRKTVPAGGTETIEFTPRNAGTFKFSCSMNMAKGTIVVQ